MMTTQTGSVETGYGFHTPRAAPRPHPSSYGVVWSVVLAISDAIALVCGALLAGLAVHADVPAFVRDAGAVQAAIVVGLVWLAVNERSGMYRQTFAVAPRDEAYASIAASGIAFFPVVALIFILHSLEPFRYAFLLAIPIGAIGVGSFRFAALSLRSRLLPNFARRIAVVGSPDRVAVVPNELSLSSRDQIVRIPVESFDDEVAEMMESGDVLRLEWLRHAFAADCDTVIVTEALPAEIMPSLLRLTEARQIKIAFAPMRFRPHACDFTTRRDGSLALIYPQSLAICRPQIDLVRRAIDLAIVIPALLVLAPVLILIGLAVMIDSGRPIFYTQVRVGKLGREFRIIKFRTMRPDAEAATGPVWARSGENRVTRIGKFLRRTSLDELPQLWNVVRGDMAVVGPRPERPVFVERFRKILPRYDERHLVRPGITGWSHVHMRRNVDTSAIGERLAYDLFYLEHWSVFMDALTICKTAAEFLFHSAAA
jgi:exopolysaccharide biosynthesis polyprenyl glycosylphosphotransferase